MAGNNPFLNHQGANENPSDDSQKTPPFNGISNHGAPYAGTGAGTSGQQYASHGRHAMPAPQDDSYHQVQSPAWRGGHAQTAYGSAMPPAPAPRQNGGPMPTTPLNEHRFEQPTGPASAPYGLNKEPVQVQEEAVTATLDDDGKTPLGLPWYGCPFPDACMRFLKNYAKFTGRASKSEFWWPVVAIAIATVVFNWLTSLPGIIGNVFSIVYLVFMLSLLVPSFAVMTRRAHDANMSGWWVVGYAATEFIGLVLIMIGAVMSFTPRVMTVLENMQSVSVMSDISFNPAGLNMIGGGVLLMFAGFILYLVIGLKKTDPAGERFDKQTIAKPPVDSFSSNVIDE